MIADNMKNCKLYYGANERFEKAFDFIKKACGENLPVGKYEIDGTNLYAMVQEYNSKAPEDGKFEAHRNYIDIQYIISGTEKMEVMDISRAVPKSDYNDQKDVMFYENEKNASVGIYSDGEYGVFFPHDVHKPGMATDSGSELIKKIVVKVKIG